MSLDMGVCASSGSVGFWPIIPAALGSQLSSHAHIWHSFPDMITIHLPLRFWLCGIFPLFPSGTEARFQKWTAHPSTLLLTPLYPTHAPFPFRPTVALLLFASSTDSCCLAIGILWSKPFTPWVSCLCLPAWSGHLAATTLGWPPARIGKEGEGWWGEGLDRREAQPWGFLSPAALTSTVLSDPLRWGLISTLMFSFSPFQYSLMSDIESLVSTHDVVGEMFNHGTATREF